MTPARCPICDDIISIGISVKLHQAIICPTCLANLQVVSLNPLELEIPETSKHTGTLNSRKNHREGKKHASSKKFWGYDEFDDEDFDDYTIERRLRHKSERDKHRKSTKFE
jgi:lysine biosynthesis protein LysW